LETKINITVLFKKNVENGILETIYIITYKNVESPASPLGS
jgi:hypothetical protein